MEIKHLYICPVCDGRHESIVDATACRNKHPIVTEQWAFCGICSAGWKQNLNPTSHIYSAKLCESRHMSSEKR